MSFPRAKRFNYKPPEDTPSPADYSPTENFANTSFTISRNGRTSTSRATENSRPNNTNQTDNLSPPPQSSSSSEASSNNDPLHHTKRILEMICQLQRQGKDDTKKQKDKENSRILLGTENHSSTQSETSSTTHTSSDFENNHVSYEEEARKALNRLTLSSSKHQVHKTKISKVESVANPKLQEAGPSKAPQQTCNHSFGKMVQKAAEKLQKHCQRDLEVIFGRAGRKIDEFLSENLKDSMREVDELFNDLWKTIEVAYISEQTEVKNENVSKLLAEQLQKYRKINCILEKDLKYVREVLENQCKLISYLQLRLAHYEGSAESES